MTWSEWVLASVPVAALGGWFFVRQLAREWSDAIRGVRR